MASFDDVLARIPGYGGFHAKRLMNEREDQAALQEQMTMMKIADTVRARKSAMEGEQRNEALRQAIAALPPEKRTRENVLPLILQHSRDASQVISALPAAAERGEPIGSGGLLKDGKVIPPAARPATPEEVKPIFQQAFPISQTHVQPHISRDNGVTWTPLPGSTPQPRFQPDKPEKPPKLPNPKQGYRWNADGTEQERIPGGPVDVKYQADKGQAKKSVGLALDNASAAEKAISALETDPGLPRITGTIMGRTPNVTNLATGAQAKLDSLKSQIFVAALQAMRDASKTGGAVGNVTEREGDKLESTLAALSQAQGTDDFKNQLRIAKDRLKTSQALIRKAYEEQFGESWSDSAPGAPTPPGAPQPAAAPLSAEEQAELARLRAKHRK